MTDDRNPSTRGWEEASGPDRVAPDAVAALAVLSHSTARETVRSAVEADPACADFAEQFVVDVSSVTDGQRAALAAALGPATFGFVQALYVSDFTGRVAHAWRQLFGIEPAPFDPQTVELWPAINEFLTSVARLRGLDPLTSELVRLRGARPHDCRLCKTLRSVPAIEMGGTEERFDAVDRYETSDLPDRQKVALRLTDAILWQPEDYPEGLEEAVRQQFTPAEAVEIVLDVMRNAANKIAVALGADAPHVEDGVEYYDIDDRGELVYGLTPGRS